MSSTQEKKPSWVRDAIMIVIVASTCFLVGTGPQIRSPALAPCLAQLCSCRLWFCLGCDESTVPFDFCRLRMQLLEAMKQSPNAPPRRLGNDSACAPRASSNVCSLSVCCMGMVWLDAVRANPRGAWSRSGERQWGGRRRAIRRLRHDCGGSETRVRARARSEEVPLQQVQQHVSAVASVVKLDAHIA